MAPVIPRELLAVVWLPHMAVASFLPIAHIAQGCSGLHCIAAASRSALSKALNIGCCVLLQIFSLWPAPARLLRTPLSSAPLPGCLPLVPLSARHFPAGPSPMTGTSLDHITLITQVGTACDNSTARLPQDPGPPATSAHPWLPSYLHGQCAACRQPTYSHLACLTLVTSPCHVTRA